MEVINLNINKEVEENVYVVNKDIQTITLNDELDLGLGEEDDY